MLRAGAGVGHVEAAVHSLREARKVLQAMVDDSTEPESKVALHQVSEALSKAVQALASTDAVLSRAAIGMEARILEAHALPSESPVADPRTDT